MPHETATPFQRDESIGEGNPPLRMRNVRYETFIVLLSVYSLMNLVLVVALPSQRGKDVVLVVDSVICLIFIGDFLQRLFHAPGKRHYLIADGGWLDLVGSLPFPPLRLARIFRLVRVGAALRQYGFRRFWHDYRQQRAESALLTVIFLIVVIVQYASLSILYVERGTPRANIRTASDALWWSLSTITTVGYGDRYPVTNAGRIVGVFLLSGGIGLFSVLSGYLANAFLRSKEGHGSDTAPADLSVELAEVKALLIQLQERTVTQPVPNDTADERSQTPAIRS